MPNTCTPEWGTAEGMPYTVGANQQSKTNMALINPRLGHRVKLHALIHWLLGTRVSPVAPQVPLTAGQPSEWGKDVLQNQLPVFLVLPEDLREEERQASQIRNQYQAKILWRRISWEARAFPAMNWRAATDQDATEAPTTKQAASQNITERTNLRALCCSSLTFSTKNGDIPKLDTCNADADHTSENTKWVQPWPDGCNTWHNIWHNIVQHCCTTLDWSSLLVKLVRNTVRNGCNMLRATMLRQHVAFVLPGLDENFKRHPTGESNQSTFASTMARLGIKRHATELNWSNWVRDGTYTAKKTGRVGWKVRSRFLLLPSWCRMRLNLPRSIQSQVNPRKMSEWKWRMKNN